MERQQTGYSLLFSATTPAWRNISINSMEQPNGIIKSSRVCRQKAGSWSRRTSRLVESPGTDLSETGQVDIGAPFLRQYLEYKLGQIITKLEIPVPPDYATRGDKRTLSTYIDAILNAVDLYQAAGRCILTTQQITNLQTHHAPSIIANFVSHYEDKWSWVPL